MAEGIAKWLAARRRRDWAWLALVGMVLGAGLVVVAWSQREWLGTALVEGRDWLQTTLQEVPLWLYCVLFVVLPAVGMPLTLFYLTVGAMAESLWLALPLAWVCVLGNMAVAYFLGRKALHAPIERLVRARGLSIPQVSREMEWKLILMLRSSPIPWVMQNYILALAGVRFLPYLFLSILVQGLVGAGMIVVGDSLFSGQAKYALLGVFLFFLISFGVSVLRRKTAAGAPEAITNPVAEENLPG
jgi:uncharacterized membrane protein YdjX (TVP38/TMEM64 family)